MPQISEHPYRLLTVGGSGSRTRYWFFFLNAKDPFEAHGQFLINKREDDTTKHFNDFEAFVEYSNNME